MLPKMRAQLPTSRTDSKTRLRLRTPDGDRWDLIVSDGVERFIGHYSQVPGLGSGDRLLEYQPVGCARSG